MGAHRTGAAGVLTFAAGVGLGLLLASAFSAFYWWWAVGAAMFGIAERRGRVRRFEERLRAGSLMTVDEMLTC